MSALVARIVVYAGEGWWMVLREKNANNLVMILAGESHEIWFATIEAFTIGEYKRIKIR